MKKYLYNLSSLVYLLPILLIVIVYFPALSHGKVWDDWYIVGDFMSYKDPNAWSGILLNSLPFSENYFRPLVMLTYVLEGYFGLGDFFSHLVNIIFHGINTLIFALLAMKLLPIGGSSNRRNVSVLLATIYALHPAMSEAVVWIAGRFDLMATTFVLLAIYCDQCASNKKLKIFAIALFYFFAMLCKEMSVTLPVLLFLVRFSNSRGSFFKQEIQKDRLFLYLGLAIVFTFYISFRYSILGHISAPDPEMSFINTGSPAQRILLVGAAFWQYLSTIFTPFDLRPLQYTSLPIPLSDTRAWMGLVSVLIFCFGFFIAVRLNKMKFAVAFAAAGFVSLLPAIQIILLPMLAANTLTGDRVVMIPVALVLLGIGGLVPERYASRIYSPLLLIIAFWLVLCLFTVRSMLPIWQSDEILFGWLSAIQPQCSICHVTYAQMAMGIDGPEYALKEARRGVATAQQPWQVAMALNMQAKALSKLNRVPEALAALDNAIEIEPVPKGKVRYIFTDVELLIQDKQYTRALERLEQSRLLVPEIVHTSEYLMQLGNLALATGRPDIASRYYDMATLGGSLMKRNSTLKKVAHSNLWEKLGDDFAAKNDKNQAELAYAEARRLLQLEKNK